MRRKRHGAVDRSLALLWMACNISCRDNRVQNLVFIVTVIIVSSGILSVITVTIIYHSSFRFYVHLTYHSPSFFFSKSSLLPGQIGQDWDSDLEEFNYYDLTTDSYKTLSLTDEDFLEQLKTKKSLAKVLSSSRDVVASRGITALYSIALYCIV